MASKTTPAGSLKIDPVTLATNIPGVFGGGDAAFPPSLLITCAQQGKLARASIDAYLHGETARAARDARRRRGASDRHLQDDAALRADRSIHPDRSAGAPQRNH